MMESSLRTHLLSNATIAAAVGSRIYPLKGPQAETTLPKIVYQRVSSQTLNTHAGFGGHQTSRVQIKTVASGYLAAKELSSLVQGMADSFRGNVWGTLITDCRPQGQIDLPESTPPGTDRGANVVSQDWLVSWKE